MLMVYSPFVPYFKFDFFKGKASKCWVAADCLFEAAGESRKQQFAATALIMGLIPLTLKDIAWPERRIIYTTERLHWTVEILVLALGLIPTETKNKGDTRAKSQYGTMLATAAWSMSRSIVITCVVSCASVVVLSYCGMFYMELYSKRSALGCPFPAWIVAWYLVAIIPAAIHSAFAGIRRMISAVQGADEDWPVQIAWAIYYIAGTLIFTSIMAVTVLELIVWVGLGFAVTGSSKLLAFFICLVFEDTG
ncbi:hypothetical protein CC86DRAFT_390411 [Ophiobolus disseminans]|uniref:Uncharacterized protein n=1 Tax=Ophiobolus disseminans TaxID=1469910 RepID=A0A6A7AGD5_9PLEO|nr:hypothetical protein CC86DRAFT_390411 [Ophiobolus disseminans]